MVFQNTNGLGYYVYAYLNEDNKPYYIGKGSNDRAYHKHSNVKTPDDRSRIMICESNLTEMGAYSIERKLIAQHKDTVVNKSAGGPWINEIIDHDVIIKRNKKSAQTFFSRKVHCLKCKIPIDKMNIGRHSKTCDGTISRSLGTKWVLKDGIPVKRKHKRSVGRPRKNSE